MDTEHKKILLHINSRALLELPEKFLKKVPQLDCLQQQHPRWTDISSTQGAGITLVELEVVHLDKEMNQVYQRQKQRLFLQPHLQLSSVLRGKWDSYCIGYSLQPLYGDFCERTWFTESWSPTWHQITKNAQQLPERGAELQLFKTLNLSPIAMRSSPEAWKINTDQVFKHLPQKLLAARLTL